MLHISPVHNPMMNKPIKLCANCKYAIRNINAKTECSLFYKMELVQGKKFYDGAHVARTDETKCGFEGKYYEGLTRSDNLFDQ